MARDRIQDVAYHVVHFQEAFVSATGKMNEVTDQHATLLDTMQNVLASFAHRIAVLEQWCTSQPSVYNLATPQAGGASASQATMEQPGTPAFAPTAPLRAQLRSPDHGDIWHIEGDPWGGAPTGVAKPTNLMPRITEAQTEP